MKDRLTTLGAGLIALLLVVFLFAPQNDEKESPTSRPTSVDRGDAGMLAFWTWLERSGIPVASLRTRYDSLLHDTVPNAKGNLLVMTMPQKIPARPDERNQLREWIKQGNHVLIMNASSDALPWTDKLSGQLANRMLLELGIEPDWDADEGEQKHAHEQVHDNSIAADDGADAVEPTAHETIDTDVAAPRALESEMADESDAVNDTQDDFDQDPAIAPGVDVPATLSFIPSGPHPLTRNVERIELYFKSSRHYYLDSVPIKSYQRAVNILKQSGADTGDVILFRYGAGRIIYSRYTGLFSNINLGRASNAQFAANIVRDNLMRGGNVIFDDFHHGLSTMYDAKSFFTDKRLHNTLWFLFAFWLIYVVGHSGRLGPRVQQATRVRRADFARALGGTYARYLTPQQIAQGLFAHFFNDVRARFGMPHNGEPVWDRLERHPTISRADLEILRKRYETISRTSTSTLREIANRIGSMRKEL